MRRKTEFDKKILENLDFVHPFGKEDPTHAKNPNAPNKNPVSTKPLMKID